MSNEPNDKQPTRTLSAFKLVIAFACFSLGSRLYGQKGWSNIFLALAAFFCIAMVFEFFSWMSETHKHSNSENEESNISEPSPNDEFEIVDDGDTWMERRLLFDQQWVKVRVLQSEDVHNESLPYAQDIVNSINSFMNELGNYLQSERERLVEYSQDVSMLKNVTISFMSKIEPNASEVVFEELPNGRIWACAYEKGKFFNLGFDD